MWMQPLLTLMLQYPHDQSEQFKLVPAEIQSPLK